MKALTKGCSPTPKQTSSDPLKRHETTTTKGAQTCSSAVCRRNGSISYKFGPFIIHDRWGDSDLLDLFGSLEELKKYLNIFD